jgi:hypothetical protein
VPAAMGCRQADPGGPGRPSVVTRGMSAGLHSESVTASSIKRQSSKCCRSHTAKLDVDIRIALDAAEQSEEAAETRHAQILAIVQMFGSDDVYIELAMYEIPLSHRYVDASRATGRRPVFPPYKCLPSKTPRANQRIVNGPETVMRIVYIGKQQTGQNRCAVSDAERTGSTLVRSPEATKHR